MSKPFAVFSVICLVILLTLGLTSCAPQATPAPAKQDFTQIRGAVVELKARLPETGKRSAFCSGVFLSPSTVLTSAHCDVGFDIHVNGYREFVVKKSEDRHLMLLHLPAGGGCPCVFDLATPDLDDPVFAVGFPLYHGQILTEGRWQGVRGDDDAFAAGDGVYTAPVTFGNSGGGVFVFREGRWALAAIVSRGTIIPLGGFIPAIIGHLNVGAGAGSIYDFIHGKE
jgi:hypothetical protein